MYSISTVVHLLVLLLLSTSDTNLPTIDYILFSFIR